MKLYDKLTEYGKSDYYPFHMPGHKRNTECFFMENPYGIDITEIDGFDNLHMPEGILRELKERTAKIYGTEESFLLVNGSTCGILAGITACVRHGDTIVMARNCHRAVYHSVQINELKPVYLYPQENAEWGISGEILTEDVDNVLTEHPEARLVVITSPTYEGIVSDVERIAKTAHSHGAVLLVDEAHGAHLGFHPYFPKGSVEQGADMVIHSIHKTLPSFTQTALLHCAGNRAVVQKVRECTAIFQTSSPSYVLMAGIEKCITVLEEERKFGGKRFCYYVRQLKQFYEEVKELRCLSVLGGECGKRDPSKLILSAKGTAITGARLYEILLREYHLQMEAQMPDYVIAMTSIGDREEGFRRLIQALREIDRRLWEKREHKAEKVQIQGLKVLPKLPCRLIPYEAGQQEGINIPLEESAGCIALEYAFLYPPGIPLIVPGEQITEELVGLFLNYQEKGLSVKGMEKSGRITVICKKMQEKERRGNKNGKEERAD